MARNSPKEELFLIGKKIIGLGDLVQFLQDDSHERGHFALGLILKELGERIIEIHESSVMTDKSSVYDDL